MVNENAIIEKKIWDALYTVMDPEIPVLSIVDLGIIHNISIEGKMVSIKLLPTFSGCPALKHIEKSVFDAVNELNIFETVNVSSTFDAAWTTDRISSKGKDILKKFGLAPPPESEIAIELDVLSDTPCPLCDSRNTTLKSSFGSTLCRSMHYCNNCLNAFEGFKPLY